MDDEKRTFRTIALTGRPPVRICEQDWPITATANWHDGQVECQSNRHASLRVREHADGRRIVYGFASSQWQGERAMNAGELLPAKATMATCASAIHRVAEDIGHPGLAQDCLADFPAEVISGGNAGATARDAAMKTSQEQIKLLAAVVEDSMVFDVASALRGPDISTDGAAWAKVLTTAVIRYLVGMRRGTECVYDCNAPEQAQKSWADVTPERQEETKAFFIREKHFTGHIRSAFHTLIAMQVAGAEEYFAWLSARLLNEDWARPTSPRISRPSTRIL